MQLYRIIIRVSLTQDIGSKVRNYFKGYLNKYNLENTKTGTWESTEMPLQSACAAVHELMEILVEPRSKVDAANENVALNHVWIYIDRIVDES